MDLYEPNQFSRFQEPNLDPPEPEDYDIMQFANEVSVEETRARDKFDEFNSCHEGFAVILEEVEELKVLVFNKDRTSSAKAAMHAECVQIAAMAFAFISELLQ